MFVPTLYRTTKKMFFISFVVCVISTVAFIEPIQCEIHSATSSNITAPLSHINVNKNNNGKTPNNTIYTESGPIDVVNVPNLSTNATDLSHKTNNSTNNSSTHTRRVTNTSNSVAPSVSEQSHQNKSNVTEVNATSTIVDSKQIVTKPEIHLKSNNLTSNETAKVQPSKPIVSVLNSTASNQTNVNNATQSTKQPTISTTKSTTTSTTTTTTTTTTPIPKKPTITYSVEDDLGLLDEVRKELSVPQLKTDDNEPRLLQSSETITDRGSGHDFLVPIIGMIFIIPLLIIFANCTVRRARDYWSKRKYRRMDYLIEDMYN